MPVTTAPMPNTPTPTEYLLPFKRNPLFETLRSGIGNPGSDSGSEQDGGTDSDSEPQEDVSDPTGRLSVIGGRLVDEGKGRGTLAGLSLGSIRDLKALG